MHCSANCTIMDKHVFPYDNRSFVFNRNDGQLAVSLTMPDTITKWIGNSLCTSPESGIGVSDMTGITGFQPFFVSLTLPYSAIRGEILPVTVTVFNYLQECVTVSEYSFYKIYMNS